MVKRRRAYATGDARAPCREPRAGPGDGGTPGAGAPGVPSRPGAGYQLKEAESWCVVSRLWSSGKSGSSFAKNRCSAAA